MPALPGVGQVEWGMDEYQNRLYQLSRQLGEILLENGLVCCCAESCTGGWVAKSITDLPGSSAWFEQGWVTYSNRAKEQLLQVPATLLQAHGAVSEEVVAVMAESARRLASADIAVSVSGVAGPGGGTVQKPVGTVCIGWNWKAGTQVRSYEFAGGREEVRLQSACAAILGMIERLSMIEIPN